MSSLAQRKAEEAKRKAEDAAKKAAEEESKRSAVISVAALNEQQKKNREKKRQAEGVNNQTAKEIRAMDLTELVEYLDIYNSRAKRSLNSTATINANELIRLEIARRLSMMSVREILMNAVDDIIKKNSKELKKTK